MSITRPQKAETADFSNLRLPAIVQPKIDGVRGMNLVGHFTARTLKRFRNTELEIFDNPLFLGFDGELAKGGLTDQHLCTQTTSWTNSYSHKTDRILPTWNLFDFVNKDTWYLPYYKRWELLQQYVKALKEKYPEFHFLQEVPGAFLAETVEQIQQAHAYFVSLGYEGTIIRYAHGSHKNGRSTLKEGYYLRIKDFLSESAQILGFTEAQENFNIPKINALGYTERSSSKENKIGKGMIGALIIRLPDGNEAKIGTGSLTHEQLTEYFNEPEKLIGRWCDFKHMPQGAKDKPRFGQFSCFRQEEDL